MLYLAANATYLTLFGFALLGLCILLIVGLATEQKPVKVIRYTQFGPVHCQRIGDRVHFTGKIKRRF